MISMFSIGLMVGGVLPLTQGIKILKASTLGLPIDNLIFPIIIMISIFVVCIVISVKFFKWE